MLACIVPTLSFQSFSINPCGKRSSSLCGLRSIECKIENQMQSQFSRRNLGILLFGAFVQEELLKTKDASAATTKSDLKIWESDARSGFSDYSLGELGVKFKDIDAGLGTSPKAGDYVRFQLSAYLVDGTLVSSYAGVELSQAIFTPQWLAVHCDYSLHPELCSRQNPPCCQRAGAL